MSTNSNTRKKKDFAPQQVTNELIKLHGIQFNSKCLIVEEAKTKTTAFSEANLLKPIWPVFGNHLKDENQSKIPIVLAKTSHSKMVHISPNSWNTLIITDSTAKGICTYEFNQLKIIRKSKAFMLNFSGELSHHILHHFDDALHIEDRQINTVVILFEINDILRDSSQSKHWWTFGEKKIFISGLVYTTSTNIGILEKNHVMIQNFRQKHGCF